MNVKIKLWCLGLFVAILGSQQPLIAQEAKLLHPSPRFVTVESIGKVTNGAGEKMLSVRYTEWHAGPRAKVKSGEPASEPKPVLAPYSYAILLSRLEVATVDGKEIPAKEWDKLVSKVVLWASGDGPLDPAYAKLLAKDTIILYERHAAKK